MLISNYESKKIKKRNKPYYFYYVLFYKNKKKFYNPAGTRTQNPQIRSLMRFHCATGLCMPFDAIINL